MKKHILGFAIFSFIFASFAVAFAYFYAPPIPQVAEVNLPVYYSEPSKSCRKKAEKGTDLQYEIIGSQYFYDENKVVSKIKLTWNSYENAPKVIKITTMFSMSPDLPKKVQGTIQVFERPFVKSDSVILTVTSKSSERFSNKENLYAFFSVFDEKSAEKTNISIGPTQVVYVHGENSTIKSTKKPIILQ